MLLQVREVSPVIKNPSKTSEGSKTRQQGGAHEQNRDALDRSPAQQPHSPSVPPAVAPMGAGLTSLWGGDIFLSVLGGRWWPSSFANLPEK